MKKKLSLFLALVMLILSFAGCDSESHSGEAKTPSGSSVMKGRDYQDVVDSFKENGFTNIKLEKIPDLVLGWLTSEGEVEKVTIGGDEKYSADKWVPADTAVVIYYHTFKNDTTDDAAGIPSENTGTNDDPMSLITNPSVEYIVAGLSQLDTVIGIEIGEQAGLATIYFASDLVDQSQFDSTDVEENGTAGGGSIDIFATVGEAIARDDYLAGFTILGNGSHAQYGSIVIRTSRHLDDETQESLTQEILDVLTSGEITEDVIAQAMVDYEAQVTAPNESGTTDTATESSDITVTMGSSELVGRNYTEVESLLREMGFSTFNYEVIETDDQTISDGTVEEITIWEFFFPDSNFSVGDTFIADSEVMIYYYECEEVVEVAHLTAETCPELAALLELRNPADPSVAVFARNFNGQVIEFDGCIHSLQNHGDYTTRFDVLIGAGDFDPNSMRGPNFKLTDVNYYQMNLDDDLFYGDNVRVIAKVEGYNANYETFDLDIIQIMHRG